MVRALITGGAGFIGSHLTEKLLEHGDQVGLHEGEDPGEGEEGHHQAQGARDRAPLEDHEQGEADGQPREKVKEDR